jgi:hypothetical protein
MDGWMPLSSVPVPQFFSLFYSTAVTIVTPMVLMSGLLYQKSKIEGGFLHFLANTSMVCM